MCQPLFSPCINDPENPVEERFGQSAVWSPTYMGPSATDLYQTSLPVHPPGNRINWNMSMAPRTLSVYTVPDLKPAMVEHITHFSEEAEDDDECDLLTDEYQTTPETLSPSTKNHYKPAWKSPHEPPSEPTSPHSAKRQRRSDAKPPEDALLLTPKTSRRRPQRKPSLPSKATTSYSGSPTSLSSPEVAPCGDSTTKKSHNLTEKKYRNRLNGYFDNLLAAIPRNEEGEEVGKGGDGRKVSKGEVLVLALERIRVLEGEVESLRGVKGM
jgi:hypothetical protein